MEPRWSILFTFHNQHQCHLHILLQAHYTYHLAPPCQHHSDQPWRMTTSHYAAHLSRSPRAIRHPPPPSRRCGHRCRLPHQPRLPQATRSAQSAAKNLHGPNGLPHRVTHTQLPNPRRTRERAGPHPSPILTPALPAPIQRAGKAAMTHALPRRPRPHSKVQLGVPRG